MIMGRAVNGWGGSRIGSIEGSLSTFQWDVLPHAGEKPKHMLSGALDTAR